MVTPQIMRGRAARNKYDLSKRVGRANKRFIKGKNGTDRCFNCNPAKLFPSALCKAKFIGWRDWVKMILRLCAYYCGNDITECAEFSLKIVNSVQFVFHGEQKIVNPIVKPMSGCRLVDQRIFLLLKTSSFQQQVAMAMDEPGIVVVVMIAIVTAVVIALVGW